MIRFFHFNRKLEPETKKEYSLDQIPLFSSLSKEERILVEKKARLVEYKRGDYVYAEGRVPEAFYVIISGRFRLFTKSKGDKSEKTLGYFYRGEHFGESSLLTGNVHSATVEAKTDAILFRISKENFHQLIKEIPSLSLSLNKSLGRRLTQGEVGDGDEKREVKITSFQSASSYEVMAPFLVDFVKTVKEGVGEKVLLLDLSGVLKKFVNGDSKKNTDFDLVRGSFAEENDVHKITKELVEEFSFLSLSSADYTEELDKKFSALLTQLTYQYDYLIFCLPAKENWIAKKALNFSDCVYLCPGNRTDLISTLSKKGKDLIKEYGFSAKEIKFIILHSPHHWDFKENDFKGIPLLAVLPLQKNQHERYKRVVSFLAKEWTGRLVGLVLGSGAAYGLAHIGVLRVLEQENIPIDIIAGSSIGALLGGLWGAGYNSYEIERLTRSIDKKKGFFKLLGLRDISAPYRGFFKGKQVVRFLSGYLKKHTFQDLKIPVKIVAADLFTGEEIVFESGRVVDAIRASISIPGVFRPFRYKGNYLIDGGILDPLPIRVLSEMGVKKIIAVNVLPGPKDLMKRISIKKKAYEKLLRKKKPVAKFFIEMLRKLQRWYAPNIFNVLMNSIQFMEYEMADNWAREADVYLNPVVENAHWIEFYSADKFIHEGERKTREYLNDIKELLVE